MSDAAKGAADLLPFAFTCQGTSSLVPQTIAHSAYRLPGLLLFRRLGRRPATLSSGGDVPQILWELVVRTLTQVRRRSDSYRVCGAGLTLAGQSRIPRPLDGSSAPILRPPISAKSVASEGAHSNRSSLSRLIKYSIGCSASIALASLAFSSAANSTKAASE